MNTGTDENLKVILDTNILISAIAFGGNPRQVLNLVLDEKMNAIISPILLAELQEIINKKFVLKVAAFELLLDSIKDIFQIVHPNKILKVVRDEDDNRVLEAAIEGKCDYIITGDKDLLELGSFKNIEILTADQFLNNVFKG